MDEKYNHIKKIVLLAILPLLVGTVDLISALLFSGILIVIAFITRIISSYTGEFFEKKANWILLWGIGFALANFIYIILPEIFPSIENSLNFYVLLIGVSPIVYVNCNKANWTKFSKDIFTFLFMMLFLGFIREFLGQGSIFSNSFLNNSPFEILAEPAGAFLILGLTAFFTEIFYNYLQESKNSVNNPGQQKGREVSK